MIRIRCARLAIGERIFFRQCKQLGDELDQHFDAELVFSRLFAGRVIEDAVGTDVSLFGSSRSLRY